VRAVRQQCDVMLEAISIGYPTDENDKVWA